MEGCKGGISTPSYKQAVANRGNKPIEEDRYPLAERQRNREKEQEGSKSKENNNTKERKEANKE